ncbi:MAG: Maf family protein [Acidobacteriota bacterium]|nr:Maf family protein [Acidobacteriota bacterium]
MLVLASRSPRRAELMSAAGFEFTVRVADVDETPREGENPEEYVLRVAAEKAAAVAAGPREIILAADTTVAIGSELMGKPAGDADAAAMLAALSGRRHDVITGVCVRDGDRTLRECCSTAVWFAPLSDEEIEWYVASGEPMDKAGAYGIQGLASRFVERIEGSYSNVVGLPIAVVYRLLGEINQRI